MLFFVLSMWILPTNGNVDIFLRIWCQLRDVLFAFYLQFFKTSCLTLTLSIIIPAWFIFMVLHLTANEIPPVTFDLTAPLLWHLAASTLAIIYLRIPSVICKAGHLSSSLTLRPSLSLII